MMPSWSSLAVAFLGPLGLALCAKALSLSEKPSDIAIHFIAGAGLAFVALIAEGYFFGLLAKFIDRRYVVLVEMFAFVALTEEVVKIAQIAELARRQASSLRGTIAIGIVVAAVLPVPRMSFIFLDIQTTWWACCWFAR